ncbi:protein FAR1-RELATED SEQUENCE 5-like [Arachis hypogaea]|uniref:protein FAR1-RELATED SEQUENCE 5-like n=1 Tax=Arachis hypogaea TaxID=3818 RepID=UPI000DEC767D|nr:protein FAR1-RELATED SEQUENCE 5-like [Arachis hypogaea]
MAITLGTDRMVEMVFHPFVNSCAQNPFVPKMRFNAVVVCLIVEVNIPSIGRTLHNVGRWSLTLSVKTPMGGSSDDYSGHYRGTNDEYDDEESSGANDEVGSAPSRQVFADDFLGREFATEEDAYAAYKEFSKFRGFGVRKGDVARVNGVLVRKDFFCHRQRTRHSKYYDRPKRVRTIMDEHNHELAPAMFTHLLLSHRKMSDGDKAQVDSFKQFGIAIAKIMAYMAGQSGGVEQICDGDVATTISYLEGKTNADMITVARYTRTEDNRLGSLFWVDGEMMSDYQVFGDVLAFDSTYRSNKYRKPLVVFSVSNHDKQTCIFGFTLLEDEEVRTYRWMLLNLLDVMGQKKPCVVVMDGDKAMRAAIAEVMPTVTHRLCGWHLEKNCVQMVKDTEFCKVFKKALYANFEIDDFEEY